MRAGSLFFVFVLAKAAVLAGHPLPRSAWTPIAFFWQDALIAAAFALLEWRSHKRVSVGLYWLLALSAAVNIPVGPPLSTPLPWPMLRAARGPLSDSIVL